MTHYPLEKNISGVIFIGSKSSKLLSSKNNFVFDSGNNRLGINVSNPSYTLDVSGTGNFTAVRFPDGTVQTTAGISSGLNYYDFNLTVGNESGTVISSGETVRFSGLGNNILTRSGNYIFVSGSQGITYSGTSGIALVGNTFITSGTGFFNSINLTGAVSSTINNLYNTSGQLYFNGSPYVYLPNGGLEGQLLYKVYDTGNELAWIDNYALELRELVKNDTGSGLLKGTAVMATGAVGDRIRIARSIANGTVQSRYMLGVLSEDIADSMEGYVTLVGSIKGLNTIAYPVGTLLWLDPNNPGGLTSGQPTSPNLQMSVAIVTNSHATNGRMFVRMWEQQPALGELSDVDTHVNLQSNDLLSYNTGNNVWRNIPNFSGYLQSQINTVSGLLYNYWTLNVTGNNDQITKEQTVTFTGAGAASISYNSSTNTITISGTDTNTAYSAGTGLNLIGTTFNVSGSTTSNSGIVQLQDSVQDNVTNRAITPNAVFDYVGEVSGALDTRLNSTGNTLIGLIDGKDNYQYWTLRGDSATTTQVQTTEQVQFTGAGSISVSLGGTDNRTVTISGSNAGSSSVVGPANTVSFFSGNGALTGSSTLTYDPVKTSFTLTTQGDTPSTGFVIFNNQNQSGNVFQIRSYIRDVNSNLYNNQYTSSTGDGSYTSNAGFQNNSQTIELIYGNGTFATGFLPFAITGYASGRTEIQDGAYITVYNANGSLTGTIYGSLALYTGDANPIAPTGTGSIATQVTKLSEYYDFVISGSGSNSTLSQDIDLTPVLSRYFNLYPNNTGNVLFYYLVSSTTGGVVQNSIGSATNSDTGLTPKLDISFRTYEYAGTNTNKPIYSVDNIGRIKVGNIERSDQLINSFLFYASGEPNQAANIQIESPNNSARVLFTKNNQRIFSAGTVNDNRFVIRDEANLTTPFQIYSQTSNNGSIVIRDGYIGVKTFTPQYTLHVNGQGFINTLRLRSYSNVNLVPQTTRTIYAIGSSLYWDGNLLSSGSSPGGSYSWTVRDGSNNSETVADAMTVYWSGAGNVSTLYTAATNVMRISGSPGWNLGVGNESTSGVSNNSNITFTGLGNVTVTRNGGQISISGASTTSSGTSYDWKLSAGSGATTTITSGTNVSFTGFGNVVVTRNGNEIRISGSASSGGTPAGSNTYVQFNNAGAFGGDSNFTWTSGTRTLAIGNDGGVANTSGGYITNYWYTNNFCIGGANFDVASIDGTSDENTAIGIGALNVLGAGADSNTAIGYYAGRLMTIGTQNTLLGERAGQAITTSNFHTMIGRRAGYNNNGAENTIIGADAMYDSSASFTTAIGYQAGYNADGNYSIHIGHKNVNPVSLYLGSGNIIINMHNAYGTILGAAESNRLIIGNVIAGNISQKRIAIGDANTNPNATLEIIVPTSTGTGCIIKGASSQSASLLSVTNNAGTGFLTVSASGKVYSQSEYGNITNSGTVPTGITLDLNQSNIHMVRVSGNTTISLSNQNVGQRFMVRVEQANSSNNQITWNFPSGNIKWAGGSAPTISSGNGYATLVGFIITSGTYFYDGFVIATGIR